MLTSVGAKMLSRNWRFALFGAAMMLSVTGADAAHAALVESTSCLDTWDAFSCVTLDARAGNPFIRRVPQPSDEAELARAKARDKKWLARCRPVIAQDRYGVARYHYAEPGCEFGVGEDEP